MRRMTQQERIDLLDHLRDRTEAAETKLARLLALLEDLPGIARVIYERAFDSEFPADDSAECALWEAVADRLASYIKERLNGA